MGLLKDCRKRNIMSCKALSRIIGLSLSAIGPKAK